MRDKILIVDKNRKTREMLAALFQKEYFLLEAEDKQEAWKWLEEKQAEIAAVLFCIRGMQEDEDSLLSEINGKDWFSRIPVAVYGEGDQDALEQKCMEQGMAEFLRLPFHTATVSLRVRRMITTFGTTLQLGNKVQKQAEVIGKQYKLLTMQAGELQRINSNIMEILGNVVEYRNLENGEHIKSVKRYTEILARRMMKDYPECGLNEKMVRTIVTASTLHDIGKIAIPDSILLKPGKLTSEEYEYMKSHTLRGAEILEKIREVWDGEFTKTAYDICRNHHERYDGNGYPDGLKEKEIPLAAQLVSLADVYDALVNERVYKEAYTKEKAYQMIIMGECGMFSPKLLECFRNAREEFENQVDLSRENRGTC